MLLRNHIRNQCWHDTCCPEASKNAPEVKRYKAVQNVIQFDRTHRCCEANAHSRHIGTYMPHSIEDGHPSRDWATRRVDVKRDVLRCSVLMNIYTANLCCGSPFLDRQHLTKEAALRLSYSCHRLQHHQGGLCAAPQRKVSVSPSKVRSLRRYLMITSYISCCSSHEWLETFTNLGH